LCANKQSKGEKNIAITAKALKYSHMGMKTGANTPKTVRIKHGTFL